MEYVLQKSKGRVQNVISDLGKNTDFTGECIAFTKITKSDFKLRDKISNEFDANNMQYHFDKWYGVVLNILNFPVPFLLSIGYTQNTQGGQEGAPKYAAYAVVSYSKGKPRIYISGDKQNTFAYTRGTAQSHRAVGDDKFSLKLMPLWINLIREWGLEKKVFATLLESQSINLVEITSGDFSRVSSLFGDVSIPKGWAFLKNKPEWGSVISMPKLTTKEGDLKFTLNIGEGAFKNTANFAVDMPEGFSKEAARIVKSELHNMGGLVAKGKVEEILELKEDLVKKPWEMTKKEFGEIVDPKFDFTDLVKKYVKETGLKVKDMKVVLDKYPREYAELSKLEKMRQDIYDSLPKEVRYHFKSNEMSVSTHKEMVGQAILDGKKVPSKVLADYPDLKLSTKIKENVEPIKITRYSTMELQFRDSIRLQEIVDKTKLTYEGIISKINSFLELKKGGEL